jgi:hypothetical protein
MPAAVNNKINKLRELLNVHCASLNSRLGRRVNRVPAATRHMPLYQLVKDGTYLRILRDAIDVRKVAPTRAATTTTTDPTSDFTNTIPEVAISATSTDSSTVKVASTHTAQVAPTITTKSDPATTSSKSTVSKSAASKSTIIKASTASKVAATKITATKTRATKKTASATAAPAVRKPRNVSPTTIPVAPRLGTAKRVAKRSSDEIEDKENPIISKRAARTTRAASKAQVLSPKPTNMSRPR